MLNYVRSGWTSSELAELARLTSLSNRWPSSRSAGSRARIDPNLEKAAILGEGLLVA